MDCYIIRWRKTGIFYITVVGAYGGIQTGHLDTFRFHANSPVARGLLYMRDRFSRSTFLKIAEMQQNVGDITTLTDTLPGIGRALKNVISCYAHLGKNTVCPRLILASVLFLSRTFNIFIFKCSLVCIFWVCTLVGNWFGNCTFRFCSSYRLWFWW